MNTYNEATAISTFKDNKTEKLCVKRLKLSLSSNLIVSQLLILTVCSPFLVMSFSLAAMSKQLAARNFLFGLFIKPFIKDESFKFVQFLIQMRLLL